MKTIFSLSMALSVLTLSGCSSANKADPSPAAGPKAYVGLFGDNAVAVVDTASGRVLTTIPVPTGPHGVVITPDGRKVYVSSDGATTVSVISTSTDTIVTSIEVGMTPHGLAISPDGTRVLLADFGGDRAELIDTASDTVSASVSVPRPHNSAISSDGKQAFVGSQQMGTPSIAIVDLQAASEIGSVALEQAPRALDYAPSGMAYFTLMGVDALQVLDPATQKLGTAIATGASPHHMLATKDGAFELVVSQKAGDLEFVDPAAGMVVANVPTGLTPHWIALSQDGEYAYVTNEGSNSLSVVDLADRAVKQTIMVGMAPRKIAVQPGLP